ncbi:MAG TPA: PKD domain-containing protein [Candidatus Angelobacter sp.]|nr:PKD domain-containing protein [Candidatus Angelobacter sp.]
MMHSHGPASTRKSAGYFHRNGLLAQLISVLLAWTMVMSSLPVYATDQPRTEWVLSRGGDGALAETWPQKASSGQSETSHKLDGASLSGLKHRKERVGAGRIQLASLKTPAGLGSTHALLQSTVPGESSIASNFNGTAIPGGSFLWFSSVIKASGLGSQPVRVFLRAASLQFTAGGATYNLPVPDATITFSPTATSATTSFDASKNAWITNLPSTGLAGNSFLSGMTFPVPANGLPGGINPVTWSGTFYSDTSGVSINWQWAAAVYTSFGGDYRTLNVKPVDDTSASVYKNSDHAGTPEAYKTFVTGGARGGGGSNYTGSYSATASVLPLNEVPNYPPVANAGPAQTVFVGTTVQLDGSGSTDQDGNPLTYRWSFVSIPSRSTATLNGANTVKPTFVPDAPGSYTVQLIVNDGLVDSSPSTVTISTKNSPPVANAGPDQTITTGAMVQLDGSRSTDVDGDALTYSWSFVSVPAGSTATLSNSHIVNPTFVADKKGSYTVQLVVNDGTFNSAPSQVSISDVNSPPVANAGAAQTVVSHTLVTLDGSRSTDVDGDSLTYTWSILNAPAGSAAVLSDVHAVKPTFTVDLLGDYVIQLIVNDGTVNSTPATVTITTENSPPVANAGPAQTVPLGSVVTLDGTGSSDVDGQTLTYAWSILSTPANSTATLNLPTSGTPTFIADKAGNYVIQLIVNDGILNSQPATVMISTINSIPVANPGAAQSVESGSMVALDGSGSSDADGDPLTFTWAILSQPSGGTALLSDADSINPTFVANVAGLYVVQLIVNDGKVDSPPMTVTITAESPQLKLSAPAGVSALPGQSVSLEFTVSNPGNVPAQGAAVTEGASTVSLGAVAPEQSLPSTFSVSVPAVAPKDAAENDAAYLSRLQSSENQITSVQANLAWNDLGNAVFGPVSASTSITEQFPIIAISLAAPANANSGNSITYTVTLNNAGHATAAQASGTIVLPNGTQQPFSFSTIAAGASVQGTFTFSTPRTQASGPITATASAIWQDGNTNSYGPLSASTATALTQPNQPPIVDAGPNQIVPFPNAYPLQGHVTDDGLPNATLISTWTQISGPSVVTFADPHSPTSTVFLSTAGTYVFRLTADDSQLQASADVAITTTSANLPPVVKVGPDQTITLPVNAVSLTGSASDDGLPAGSTLTFLWSKVAGPGTVTFANATSPNTPATFSESGTYLLRLTASDSQLTGSAQMRVTVLPFNDPPVVNAGPDQTIIWPANTVTLAGIATDDGMPAGSVLKTNWAFVSGPTAVLFGNSTVLNTTVRFNSPGTYILRLTADDSQFRSSDDVTITVRSLIDGPPHIISSPITQFITDPSATPLPTYTYVVVATDPENDPLDYMLTTFPAGMSIDSATGAITWTPTQNDLGPHTVAIKVREASGQFDTQSYVLNVVTQSSISPLGSLVLSPASAGPVVVGTAQQLQAFFADGNNAPVANAVITFTVTGPNATTGTATTDSSGKAKFVYSGAASGVDSIVASTSAGSTTLNSNTSTINWVVPAQPISTTTINGRIFASNGSGTFNTPPTATPAFVQNFPTINFNPPTGTVPGMPGSIGVNTRPFTDVTTDLNGNFTGSIIAQGNGLQAGVGALFNFQAVFTGSYTVAAAGDVTFNFFSDDGFIFGVNNGATRVSGSLFNPPPSGLTPFQGYPVMGAFNTATAPVANSITVHFPGPGTYQYEIDYSECCAGELAVTMTSSLSGNHGVPSSGTVTLTPGTNVSKNIGGTATFSALLTDASGAIIPNVPVLFNVAGANTIQFQGVSDSTGRATFSYQSFRTGTDIVQANAQITGMTAVSNQTLVTWNSAANTAPVVNAGTNQTITLPTNSATLSGTATDDGLPNGTLTTTWTQVSGPVQAAIANPNQLTTVVSFTQPGSYVFKLSASDSVLTTSANLTITVNQQNLAPSISISVDSTFITQPANSIHVTGTVTDDGFPTGSTLSIQWTEVSGPAAATFSTPNSPNTSITLPAAGTYVLKLSASDSQLTSSVNVTITVNPPAPNQAPTVTIVASQTLITLPSNVVTLSGKISDDGLPLGAPITTQWSQVSGPLPVTFSTPASSSTQVGFPAAGTYVLQLAASDLQLTGSATISITVNSVGTNQAPTVAIIADHTSVTLPTNTVTLNGVINDDGLPNGTIGIQWAQISGPAAVNIAQVTSTSVKVSFPAAGVYVIKLTANDGQLSSEATITITVTTSGGNQPPTVSAGPSQSIQLPQNTVTLNGYAADDGLPAGSTLVVHWTEISGPASVSFSNPSSVVTQATFSVAGVYVLQLSASDSQLQTTAQVTITVANAFVPPPTPPSVSFSGFTDGQEITKPTPIFGSVTTGSWKLEYSLLDGAGNPTTFTTFASGVAPVSNATLGTFDPTVLLNGQYVVRFSSTDNAGQTSTTTNTVDVSRNTKIGNFTLSFNDLSVPLPGLPITVTRTYDSRDKRVGDFGVGWTLSVANVRVQKTGGAIGTGWDEETQWSGFFPTYCLQPLKNHTVSVTFPDGKVYKFQAVNTPQCQQFVPITAPQIGFVQVPTGSDTAGATLTPISDTDLLLDGSIPGPVNLINFDLEFGDFTQFQLTTAEGYAYILDQKLGVTSVTDPNGNKLTINAVGITSTTGASVAFVRDAQNRITRITDPNGAAIQYGYDGNGDLVQVIDRSNQSTTLDYGPNHSLTDIIDPRGVQAVKNTFSDNGVLLSTTDARGNTITYSADVAAQHETVIDRMGNPTLYEYDADGNITRTTDPLGNVTSATYDANDNKLTETDAFGKTTTYTYDAIGNRTSETDPLGNKATYTYNSHRQALTITDPLGNVTTNTYDNRGNLLTTKDAAGNVISRTYNAQGLPLTITDKLNHVTSFQYDGNGNVIQKTDALNNVSSFTYDSNGNKLTQAVIRTRSDGTKETLTTQYQYDGNNRLVKTIYPDGSTTQTVYDVAGRQSDIFDALNHKIHYDYDENGRLIKTTYADGTSESTTYDANDRRLSSTDRAGRVTSYNYDAVGHLTKTTYPDGSNTQTVYDAYGHAITSINELGNATHYGFDDAGHRTSMTDALGHVTNFAYNAIGNQVAVTDAESRVTQYVYDGLNRRVKTIYPDQTTASITYDALGREISQADQAGKVTQYGYDPLGRLTSVTQSLNGASLTTTYAYDELGNRIAQTDANGHVTSFAYDQRGRRTSRNLPLGMTELYGYDAAGNLLSKQDFNGHTTTYQYDTMNRLTKKSADAFFVQNAIGAAQIGFTYTATGRRLSMTDASGISSYAYDTRDRLLTKTTPFGTLTYTYDVAGNILSLNSSNAGGASMTYTYDVLNRLDSVTSASGKTAYTYDVVGNLSSFAYPNSISTSYGYDALNRLTSMQSICGSGTGCRSPGAQIASYVYTLAPAGNRLSVAELSGRTVRYGYDDLYRLTSESISGPSTQNGTLSYQYDAVGNRLGIDSTVSAIPASGLLNYDANDRISTDVYDNNGSTVNNGIQNVYDFENRLVQRGGVTLVYDGDGNRVSETVAGTTTIYLVTDQNPTGYVQVLEELQAGAVTRAYTYGYRTIEERQTLGGVPSTSFYGYDGHGSVRFLMDATGAVTDTYDYDAFGNLIESTGSTPNNYLFAGEQFDSALGIYYNRARYLSTITGRFLTADQAQPDIRAPHTLHRYLYAANNPANRIDPSGYDDLAELSVSESISETLDTIPAVEAGPAEDAALEAAQAETDSAFESSFNWREAEQETAERIGGNPQEYFETSRGARIVDAYNPETEVAAESKSGFVRYSDRIITQIEKDGELLNDPDIPIKEYEWHFFRSPYTGRVGADPRVFELLEKYGIKWVITY